MKLSDIKTWKHNNVTNNDSIDIIKRLKPQYVVDCGAGDGFYGKLVKCLLKDVHVIGIEKTTEYISKFELEKYYNYVINNDVLDVLEDITGDLVIFGDILEHLNEDDVQVVLKYAERNFKHVLINAPLGWQPQEHENPNEVHRCAITRETFKDFNVQSFKTYPAEKDTSEMLNCVLKGI